MDAEDTSQHGEQRADEGERPGEKPHAIDVKLLSPSPEVPASGLFLEGLPTTTTLGELRTRITSALASHPPPARQRLIYFGRVLQRDEDTLASVFGESNVQQQRQHTLHLVLPLREAGAQREAAPSPVPSVRASIYPPSSIPRPSSVPPRATGAASPFRGPVNWQPHVNAQIPPPASVAPATNRSSLSAQPIQAAQAAQPPIQQPQPRAQAPLDQPIFRSVVGNANIRANITANGQPINLPPEVVNQLLNQHFLRNGGLEHLLPNNQPRSQSADPTTHTAEIPTAPTSHPLQSSPSGQQLFQQFMASVNDTNRDMPTPGDAVSTQDRSPGAESDERGRTHDPPFPRQNTSNPTSLHVDFQQGPAGSSQRQTAAAPSHDPSPTVREQSGVNPDGSRWSIRTFENHSHTQRPPQIPVQVPQMQFAMPFPQAFPFPQFQAGPGIHMPIATPLGGLRPAHGTPRSASPARTVSEGPRRAGTPAMELQHRLMHTNQEIHMINQLLGTVATGTMADGRSAPPLSDDQMAQVRTLVQNMNAHIDAFGNDLNALANAHPSVRFQPEFAGLSAMFQAVQGQGRGVSQRIDGLAASNTVAINSTELQTRNGPSNAVAASTNLSEDSNLTTSARPSAEREQSGSSRSSVITPAQSTPSTTSDTLSPSLISRDASPANNAGITPNNTATPEIHLLTDPTNTQHYLLVGPNAFVGTGQLPLDVLYPLLATQLPHDQLVRDFNRATREMAVALQRTDLRTALTGGFALQSSAEARHSSAATDATVSGPVAHTAPTTTHAPGQLPTGESAGVQQQQTPPPPAAAAADAVQQQPQARQQPDEMRDVLAPIVRNLWLIVRLCIFGWFFFSSGRGYGRLLILVVLGGLVYGINAGVFGRRLNGLLDGLHRHFQEIVNEARGNRPIQQQQPARANDNAGEGSSRVAAMPTPEETARILMVQHADGQRRRLRDTLRQIERTLALAFVSLWPGVGEAVVRNHERARQEAERAAAVEEEERKKRIQQQEEDERKRIEGKGKEAVLDGADNDATNVQGLGRVNKGKEKADDGELD